MSTSQQPDGQPAPLSGTLALYSSDPALPYFDTDPSLPHALVFIPGLTNTIGQLPYLPRLAAAIAPLGYSLVQPQLTSCLGGWGYTSLESDSRELAALVQYLRSAKRDRIVFMGHSTGCQDCMAYLSKDRGDDVAIDGAILQAPVSDRQDFEHNHPSDAEPDESLKLLQLAEKLVKEGKGDDLLPRTSSSSPQEERGANRSARFSPPMTAYRYFALNGKGGDDDFFSSDLGDERTVEIWQRALKGLRGPAKRAGGGKAVLAAIVGAEDEYIPDSVGAAMLYSYWKSLMPEINCGGAADAATLQTLLLPGANHEASAPEAQSALVKAAVKVCQSVLGDGTTAAAAAPSQDQHLAQSMAQQATVGAAEPEPSSAPVPPHPPSFDEIVELISTGRADSIPGVRDIPLKINEEQPSRSAMSRPLKPWERAAQGAPQEHQA